MSRIGKKVITLPEKTEASFASGVFRVKGPHGELSKSFKSDIDIVISGNEITLKPTVVNLQTNALWGSYSSLVSGMIRGVGEVYVKKLILEGIGFKSEVKAGKNGSELVMALGFSHPVVVNIPHTLKVLAEKNIITVSGVDKEEVGRFTANLRALKKPEPYKGKGFRYEKEVIKRKQGKKTA